MNILKHKKFGAVFVFSFWVLLSATLLAYVFLAEIKAPLIIHFDEFRGLDFFGNRTNIAKILAIAFFLLTLNLILSEFIFNRQRFLSYSLAFTNIVLSLLIFITILAIINVN